MAKKNCWEFVGCGREIGGKNISERGVCPAAEDVSATGLNSGINGGRICWAIAGTLCEGEPKGTLAEKHLFCANCDFYKLVRSEEGFFEYVLLKPNQLEEKI